MKTVLVLAQHPALPEAARAALDSQHFKIAHRIDVEDAEPLLARGLVDLCILDAEGTNLPGLWPIEKVRRKLISCPIIVYTNSKTWDWEEEAYLNGVRHVLQKPVRPRLLAELVNRLFLPAAERSEPPPPFAVAGLDASAVSRNSTPNTHTSSESLQILRNFSGVLTHSLDAEALLRQFLLQLREILGVNRAAVFLRQPTTLFGANLEESRRMRSACAIGLSPGLLEHFDLSFEAGIGGYLYRRGRILRRDSPEALHDREVQKEFELLGAQVAIPMLDRETLVGVACFDGRVTGEPLMNGELELIFHLLEELGLAMRNIWLHDQLATNHEMMADILRELSSACVVVSRDLTVLHANKMARQYFSKPGRRSSELEFSDLPQIMGSKIYQVLKSGAGILPFRYSPPDAAQTIYQVSIVPFQRQNATTPASALLMVEDHTQAEQLQKLEIETANLRLVKTMADRLAHEIGNTLVPLSTHQQLLAERYSDPEFRTSLDFSMSESVKRIARLANQMRFLARDAILSREAVPLSILVDEAFREAQRHSVTKSARLSYQKEEQPIILAGDRPGLKHALLEVMLNAIQANPSDARVEVRTSTSLDSAGRHWVHIEIHDNGPGFSAEAATKVPAPFFTTRHVGLGLGLTVTRKIIETHEGSLRILGPEPGHPGVVKISLPLSPGPEQAA